jgi:hypothetical protein
MFKFTTSTTTAISCLSPIVAQSVSTCYSLVPAPTHPSLSVDYLSIIAAHSFIGAAHLFFAVACLSALTAHMFRLLLIFLLLLVIFP